MLPTCRSDAAVYDQLEMARRILRLSSERWGERRAVTIVGRDPALDGALERLVPFAATEAPVLLTGETGTGKELFARALYLLSRRRQRTFLTVNCAQFADSQLTASQLFGHKRGSFTGAVADHRGIFEEADGGVVFLDEVGELSSASQAMLLRVLGEGEIVPIGFGQSRVVDVRVIAATSRNLEPLVAAGTFRADLYFRLRYLQLHVPPVRDRGDDWSLIAGHHLAQLGAAGAGRKRLTADAFEMLRRYHWPGNVREIKSVIDTGHCLSDGDAIEARSFASALERASRSEQPRHTPRAEEGTDLLVGRMTGDGEQFWEVVHRPYMERELNRAQVRAVVAHGLTRSHGSYKRLTALFNVADGDYLRFMDFLRHQDLKPAHG